MAPEILWGEGYGPKVDIWYVPENRTTTSWISLSFSNKLLAISFFISLSPSEWVKVHIKMTNKRGITDLICPDDKTRVFQIIFSSTQISSFVFCRIYLITKSYIVVSKRQTLIFILCNFVPHKTVGIPNLKAIFLHWKNFWFCREKCQIRRWTCALDVEYKIYSGKRPTQEHTKR